MSDPHASTEDLMCRELVELVSDYLTDALSAAEKAGFEGHLLGCPPCTEYLAQMKTTIELARGPAATPSQTLEQSLLDVFRSWHQK